MRCHGWVSGCGRSVGDLQMTDADTANRSYPAGVTTRPPTTHAADAGAALPGRPPQLRQLSPGERFAAAESQANAENGEMSRAGVEVCQECRGSANDRCVHGQPLLPSGSNHPPTHHAGTDPRAALPAARYTPPAVTGGALRCGGSWPAGCRSCGALPAGRTAVRPDRRPAPPVPDVRAARVSRRDAPGVDEAAEGPDHEEQPGGGGRDPAEDRSANHHRRLGRREDDAAEPRIEASRLTLGLDSRCARCGSA